MIKMTGYQYKQLEKLPWNDDWWIEEDVEFKINGIPSEDGDFSDVNLLNDNDLITIAGGDICHIDEAKEKPRHKNYEQYAKAWLKSQNATSFVVECDNDKFDEIKAMLKKAGAKVIK